MSGFSTCQLFGVKRGEPYFVYGNPDNFAVGYNYATGDFYKRLIWKISDYHEEDPRDSREYRRLYDIALKNRRQLVTDNEETFMRNLYGTTYCMTSADRNGIMHHITSVLNKEAPDGIEWQVLVNRFLERGDASWRHDPILKYMTFKKNEINFVRSPENQNKKSFDYIHVPIGISGCKDKKKFVKENYREIAKKAVDILSESKRFNKYGVPVNVLKVEKAVVTCQDELILTFGLKDLDSKSEQKLHAV